MHFYIPKPLIEDYDNLRIVESDKRQWFIKYRREYYVNGSIEPWPTILTKVLPVSQAGDFPSVSQASVSQAGDFPYFFALDLVFSERAWNYLEDLVSESVEALPLQTTTGESFFYIKVLERLDCLDYSRSVWRQNPSGLVMVDSYVFREELVKHKNIFGYLASIILSFLNSLKSVWNGVC